MNTELVKVGTLYNAVVWTMCKAAVDPSCCEKVNAVGDYSVRSLNVKCDSLPSKEFLKHGAWNVICHKEGGVRELTVYLNGKLMKGPETYANGEGLCTQFYIPGTTI